VTDLQPWLASTTPASASAPGANTRFWGDVMHHPLQFAKPDWNSVFCEFPDAALKSRR
jgi:hypothetical protein